MRKVIQKTAGVLVNLRANFINPLGLPFSQPQSCLIGECSRSANALFALVQTPLVFIDNMLAHLKPTPTPYLINHLEVSERENEIKRQEREDELKRQERDELKRQEREDEIKRQEREYELEKLKIEASMMSNGFRREKNSQNEGIQEHVPVGLQKLMRTFDPKAQVSNERETVTRHYQAARWRFVMDFVILYHGQETRTILEMPPHQTTPPHQREDI
ncbi:hypothetical protein TNCV_2654581 [Trichonephila clavipes]|nr:hypothetical protein TNCV_2654581 [Trichonephila clavipes]